MRQTLYHVVGSRVYLVANEMLTGTVTDVTGGGVVNTIAGPMIDDARFCRVHWDGTPEDGGSWHGDAELECWVYPESAVEHAAMVAAREVR